MLAVGEPLIVDELLGLASEAAALDIETRGLRELRGEQIRLAHPLYGESVRRMLPALRARVPRGRIAATLAERAHVTSAVAQRIARLQLDAGGALSPELLLDAASAANRAGDPGSRSRPCRLHALASATSTRSYVAASRECSRAY